MWKILQKIFLTKEQRELALLSAEQNCQFKVHNTTGFCMERIDLNKAKKND
jgi:hypothetical protein